MHRSSCSCRGDCRRLPTVEPAGKRSALVRHARASTWARKRLASRSAIAVRTSCHACSWQSRSRPCLTHLAHLSSAKSRAIRNAARRAESSTEGALRHLWNSSSPGRTSRSSSRSRSSSAHVRTSSPVTMRSTTSLAVSVGGNETLALPGRWYVGADTTQRTPGESLRSRRGKKLLLNEA